MNPSPKLVGVALAAGLAAGRCGSDGPMHLGKTLEEWTAEVDSNNRIDRLSAIRAVGDMARLAINGSEATSRLIEAIRHEDSAVRFWAAKSLATLGARGESAVEPLRQALEDSAPHVRVAAAEAICMLGHVETGRPVLIEGLQDPNGPTRLAAAHAIEALGEDARRAVEALQAVYKDDDFGYPARVAERILRKLDALPEM